MSEDILIRPAAAEEIDEIVAVDDDACTLYAEAGLLVAFEPDHPYGREERATWLQAAKDGLAYFAEAPNAGPVGILILGFVDGAHYLEQLSVRRRAMRRGLGRRLLQQAIAWADREPLWLTTYAHLPWNRPFYERAAFSVVPEAACSPEMIAILDSQRRWLPAPEERVAMRRLAPTGARGDALDGG